MLGPRWGTGGGKATPEERPPTLCAGIRSTWDPGSLPKDGHREHVTPRRLRQPGHVRKTATSPLCAFSSRQHSPKSQHQELRLVTAPTGESLSVSVRPELYASVSAVSPDLRGGGRGTGSLPDEACLADGRVRGGSTSNSQTRSRQEWETARPPRPFPRLSGNTVRSDQPARRQSRANLPSSVSSRKVRWCLGGHGHGLASLLRAHVTHLSSQGPAWGSVQGRHPGTGGRKAVLPQTLKREANLQVRPGRNPRFRNPLTEPRSPRSPHARGPCRMRPDTCRESATGRLGVSL